MFVRPARSAEVHLLPGLEARASAAFDDVGLPAAAALPVQALRTHAEACDAGLLLVADAGDGPVGFALLARCGGDLHLVELDVDRVAQGRGVGRRLLEAVVAKARAEGFSRVTLTTYRDVPFNAPFYARAGFVVLADEALDVRLATLRAAERASGVELAPRVAMAFALRVEPRPPEGAA